MTRAAIERRLGEIETRVAELRSPAVQRLDERLAWLGWLDNDELDWLQQLFRRWDCDGVEPSEVEQLQYFELEVRATQRMLAGEPASGEYRCHF